MKDFQAFTIPILSLKNKSYSYDFEGNEGFFALFEHSLVEKGSFHAQVVLDKSSTMIQLDFHITGSIELTCDRSLELFDYPLDIQAKHILKFGDTDEELTDEIEVINRSTVSINVAQYIYEYIGLAIPMKKIHPKLADQVLEENEEGLLVYRSKPDETDDDDEPADPRWEALRKLSDN